MDIFDKAFKITLGHEGGYVAGDPDDPGGETYFGISRVYNPTWEGWRFIDGFKKEGHVPSMQQSPLLSKLVKNLYRKNYWDKLRLYEIAELSPAIALDLFDMGVNMGIGTAAKYIQIALNALNYDQKFYPDIAEDGAVGPNTLSAFKASILKNGEELIYKIVNIQQGYHYLQQMRGNRRKEKYRGWWKRVDFLQKGGT